jgi:hypothetical protein
LTATMYFWVALGRQNVCPFSKGSTEYAQQYPVTCGGLRPWWLCQTATLDLGTPEGEQQYFRFGAQQSLSNNVFRRGNWRFIRSWSWLYCQVLPV